MGIFSPGRPTTLPPSGAAGGDLTGTYPGPTFDLTKAHIWTDNQSAPALVATGLTGSVAASRYVGATAAVAPTTGAHVVGDWVVTQTGNVYVCTAAGTPGTWVAVGGSQTATATVTTDANTFGVEHVFDLGGGAVAYWKGTVLALTPDGETFGPGAGQIGADTTAAISYDGVTYVEANASLPFHATIPDAVSEFNDGTSFTPRYLKVRSFIYDNDTGDIYAGTNHPTAQIRYDIEYR